MASADSQRPIPTPLDVSSTWQAGGPPRVMRVTFMLMPVGSTPCLSVQVSGFDDIGRLTQTRRLLSASCSSGQHFACGFLQIPPYDGHPCRSANRSPCRVGRGLSPPSRPGRPPRRAGTAPVTALRAMPGAPTKKGAARRLFRGRWDVQVEKEDPQPQVVEAFGLRITNCAPCRPSE